MPRSGVPGLDAWQRTQGAPSQPHDEYTRRAALEALSTSIDEEDTEIYNWTRDLFEDPEERP